MEQNKRGRASPQREQYAIKRSAEMPIEAEDMAEAVEAAEPEDDDGISRREMRPQVREEDPRARAARRAAEIRNHSNPDDEGVDEFYIDPNIIPPGWDYEWKRRTVWNEENASYQVQLQLKGWEPVPASRHPQYMPDGNRHSIIERKGMVLMERPTEISEAARQAEMRKARMQVRAKEEQLNHAPSGTFDRANKDSSLLKINRSYEPIPVPDN